VASLCPIYESAPTPTCERCGCVLDHGQPRLSRRIDGKMTAWHVDKDGCIAALGACLYEHFVGWQNNMTSIAYLYDRVNQQQELIDELSKKIQK